MTGLSFRAATVDDRRLAIVLAAGAASGAALLPFAPFFAAFAPACPFHALTGLPCPGCGTTRALLALARADVARAFAFNPLATSALLLGGAMCALAPLWLAARGPMPVLAPGLPARARVLLVLAIVVNWGWLIRQGA